MASGLSKLSSMTVCGEILPYPNLYNNIPLLHRFLEEALEDWLRAVEPYQVKLDSWDGEQVDWGNLSSGFMELQPFLLKSLFSYAFFFVSADNAYKNFYSRLNRANNLSGIRLKHQKPPHETPFVCKIHTIRDIAIAHMPSEKASPIDAFAAMSWQPMALSWNDEGPPDLERLTFGCGQFRGTDASGSRVVSQDLEVPGIKTAHHDHCLPYLEDFDQVCCEYLQALHRALA